MNNVKHTMYPFVTIGSIVLLWMGLTHKQFINPLFLPKPFEVLEAIQIGIRDATLFLDVKETAVRSISSFIIAVCIGTPIGILMGSSKKMYNACNFLIEFFRSIPTTALFPLFLLIFGMGNSAKISIAAWGASFIIIVNTMHGIHNIKKMKLLVAKNLKLSKLQTIRDIMFFDTLPSIVPGYRIAISISLVLIIVSEMFVGTRHGLGKRILDSQLSYNTADMFGAILITGLLGFLINKVMSDVEGRIVHWKGR